MALGGNFVAAQRGDYHAVKAPDRDGAYAFTEALRDIEERVTPPKPKFAARVVPTPHHPGISVTTDGATLDIRAADMPLRDAILSDLQPTYRRDGTIVIRLDIQQPDAVAETFDKLARYYRGLLVPPTSPDNGIAITEAQFAAAANAPAGSLGTAWSSATSLLKMVERHFGRADRIAETPAARSMDAGALEKIQGFADRVSAAQTVVAHEHSRSPRR